MVLKELKKSKKGFTLAELLIVVAIIAVLVAIAIPVFTSQLEKSREATDLANIRAAYAEVMSEATTDGMDHKSNSIDLKQKKDGWQNTAGGQALHSIVTKIIGSPSAGGQVWLEYKSEGSQISIHYDKSRFTVPGAKATIDALNFPEGSNERKILLSLEGAEKQALQLYESAGETTAVGYDVKVNSDGTYTVTKNTKSNGNSDSQGFWVKKPDEIMEKGYMVAIKDGKVASNLVYDSSSNKLTASKYHIYVNKWTTIFEGFDFEY